MIGADGGVGQFCRGEHTADARLDDRKNSLQADQAQLGVLRKHAQDHVALIGLLISSHGELVEIG